MTQFGEIADPASRSEARQRIGFVLPTCCGGGIGLTPHYKGDPPRACLQNWVRFWNFVLRSVRFGGIGCHNWSNGTRWFSGRGRV